MKNKVKNAHTLCTIMALAWFLSFMPVSYAEVLASLTTKEREFLQNNPVFTMHMEPDYAPFSFRENNRFTGYSVEFADLIANRLGVEFNYDHTDTWEQAVRKLKTGDLDVIAQMTVTEERKEYALFTSDYARYFTSLIMLKSRRDALDDLSKLDQKKVGIVKDYHAYQIIKDKFPQITVIPFETTVQVIEAVISGSIDAGISTHQVVQYGILSKFITDIVSVPIWGHNVFSTASEAFGIRKDYPLLHSAMQKAMDDLEDEKRQLQNKWFGESQARNITLSPEENLFLQNHGLVRYCIDPTWKPLEYQDQQGQHRGLSADLLKLFNQRSNVDFDHIPTQSWTETLGALESRRCDMSPTVVKTESRSKFLSFSDPYISLPLVVATRVDEVFISDFDTIAHRTFSIIQDYSIIEKLKKKYKNINIIEVANAEEGLNMVLSGNAYGYIDLVPTISQAMNDSNLVNLKISAKLEDRLDLSIATRKDLPLLASIMAKNSDSISNTEIHTMLNRWFTIRYEHAIDYGFFLRILIVALLIALFFVYRYIQISRFNQKLQDAYAKLADAQKELEHLVITDHLTCLNNRKRLDEVIESELYRSKRYRSPLGIIVIDMDHFKEVNDTYGHDIGDKVLVEIAQILKDNTRLSDVVGRWGGEEFMIICPETDRAALVNFAEQIRQKIEQNPFKTVGHRTASFGVTLCTATETTESFLARVDQALYKAKRTGRNRVVIL